MNKGMPLPLDTWTSSLLSSKKNGSQPSIPSFKPQGKIPRMTVIAAAGCVKARENESKNVKQERVDSVEEKVKKTFKYRYQNI